RSAASPAPASACSRAAWSARSSRCTRARASRRCGRRSAERADPCAARRARKVPRIPAFVFAIAPGNLLVPLNSTMIVVALPLIGRDLGADHVTLAWLVTSYLIAMASLQPIAGRLGDRFGRRRLMLGALAYFIVASVGAALSPNLLVLVAFRLQQAIAAA